jgi:LmbE family N-acetylglucosaminyl deacetylase
MKVTNDSSPIREFKRAESKEKPTAEQIRKKLQSHKRKKLGIPEDTVSISSAAKAKQQAMKAQKSQTQTEGIAAKKDQVAEGVKHSGEEGFGDVGPNNPNSAETQEKLRSILESGAFPFNPKEKSVLQEILNKSPKVS